MESKKNAQKKTKKFCSAKNIYNAKCSSNLLSVRPHIAFKLKSLGVKTDKDSRICTTCNIKISKQQIESDSEHSDESELKSQKDISDQFWLDEYEVLIESLKLKFSQTEDKNEKYKILTLLPPSWSELKISSQFGCGQYMARKAKALLQTKGILSTPDLKKPSNILSPEIDRIIDEFYIDDEVSSMMPGKKDCVSMVIDGKKQKVQKRLMLSTLAEAYHLLKTKYPTNFKFSFSHFASRRP